MSGSEVDKALRKLGEDLGWEADVVSSPWVPGTFLIIKDAMVIGEILASGERVIWEQAIEVPEGLIQ